MVKKRLTGDFETRGTLDLKKVGAYKYSLHPDTRPTCFAVKFHGHPAMMFLDFYEVNLPWRKVPEGFRYHWQKALNDGYEVSAYNAFFERCIYQNIMVERLGWPQFPSYRWRCTAAKAAACALPRALANAGEALKLTTQKDWRGHAAMMRTCKPSREWVAFQKMRADILLRKHEDRKLTPKQSKWVATYDPAFVPPPVFIEPDADPAVFEVLYEYCRIDVLAEEALDDELPDLIPQELEIWQLNQTLNRRGIRIDIPTVKKIVGMMAEDSSKKLKELDSLTMGLVTKPGARQSILDFLAIEGVELKNLQKQTVKDALDGFHLSDDMRELLEIRQALSLTSTKKYQGFLDRASEEDHRVRDLTMYHGASTGRDTGIGIQPHNFMRPLLPQKDIDFLIDMIQEAE